MNRERIEQCVEALCEKGCREVWRDIQRLDAGDPVAEVAALDAAERRAVADELKEIMAVYGEEGCPLSADC